MFRFEFHWKVFPILLLQLTAFYVGAKGANILACISSASQSHHIIETTVLEELANRGHNVIFIHFSVIKSVNVCEYLFSFRLQ